MTRSSKKYHLVFRLAKAILSLSLPHSKVAIERIFTELNLIKNEKRSVLSDTTLQSLLFTEINKIDFDERFFKDVCNYLNSQKCPQKRKY